MNITVNRERQGAAGTFGRMFLDGAFFAFTLEPAKGHMLIPAAVYKYKVEESPKFGYPTPHIQNVPGHSYEEIHRGNTVKDTLGCTLVGTFDLATSIGQSALAFARLMTLIPSEGTVTYVDPVPEVV